MCPSRADRLEITKLLELPFLHNPPRHDGNVRRRIEKSGPSRSEKSLSRCTQRDVNEGCGKLDLAVISIAAHFASDPVFAGAGPTAVGAPVAGSC